jgi:TetR/AcrR family transcriptional repressor of multidrug resistance operon
MRIRDEQKEAAVREKAIEMIVKEGFDGMSMQKLAKAADVSPATLYLYFKNREDMVNQLYLETEKRFYESSLKGFDPEMSFEEGLWHQWKTRFKNISEDPLGFRFMEQFKHSPLINRASMYGSPFKEAMSKFVHNAIKRKELVEIPRETYWALAYGPFYTLIKFHLDQKSFAGTEFKLTDHKLKQAFQQVLKSLQP